VFQKLKKDRNLINFAALPKLLMDNPELEEEEEEEFFSSSEGPKPSKLFKDFILMLAEKLNEQIAQSREQVDQVSARRSLVVFRQDAQTLVLQYMRTVALAWTIARKAIIMQESYSKAIKVQNWLLDQIEYGMPVIDQWIQRLPYLETTYIDGEECLEESLEAQTGAINRFKVEVFSFFNDQTVLDLIRRISLGEETPIAVRQALFDHPVFRDFVSKGYTGTEDGITSSSCVKALAQKRQDFISHYLGLHLQEDDEKEVHEEEDSLEESPMVAAQTFDAAVEALIRRTRLELVLKTKAAIARGFQTSRDLEPFLHKDIGPDLDFIESVGGIDVGDEAIAAAKQRFLVTIKADLAKAFQVVGVFDQARADIVKLVQGSIPEAQFEEAVQIVAATKREALQQYLPSGTLEMYEDMKVFLTGETRKSSEVVRMLIHSHEKKLIQNLVWNTANRESMEAALREALLGLENVQTLVTNYESSRLDIQAARARFSRAAQQAEMTILPPPISVQHLLADVRLAQSALTLSAREALKHNREMQGLLPRVPWTMHPLAMRAVYGNQLPVSGSSLGLALGTPSGSQQQPRAVMDAPRSEAVPHVNERVAAEWTELLNKEIFYLRLCLNHRRYPDDVAAHFETILRNHLRAFNQIEDDATRAHVQELFTHGYRIIVALIRDILKDQYSGFLATLFGSSKSLPSVVIPERDRQLVQRFLRVESSTIGGYGGATYCIAKF
jgi:hypothetical protein